MNQVTTKPLLKWSPYCDAVGHTPTERQMAFLMLDNYREILFGGAAGGGKSDALLMGALQYVDVPGYSALLLRRTYSDLALPGALMDRAAEWLQPTAARWNGSTKTWSFPTAAGLDATLTFGYLETEKSKYRYQGSELQYIGWDELTQFPESPYTYLFSRLRRAKNGYLDRVPLRVRAGSNPGGEGHAWVYERFIVGAHANAQGGKRLFVPSMLTDNPHVDIEEYMEAMEELDEITKAQLLKGLWITDPSRRPFDPEWWRGRNRFIPEHFRVASKVVARWCSWDTAYKDGDGNDWSSCAVLELTSDYRLLLKQVYREKLTFPDLPDRIEWMARLQNWDGKLRGIIIEDKGSGTSAFQTLEKTLPDDYRSLLIAFQPDRDKIQRARQTATWAKRGCLQFPYPDDENAEWLIDFEQELFSFPDAVHDDQVDSVTQGVIYLENYVATGWKARGGGVLLEAD